MDERAYPYFEEINRGLLRLWGKRTGLHVLDVGCGYATTSAEIQRLGNHVTGIEESETAVTVAAKRIERVIKADVVEFDGFDRKFDVIIFADVLEHLPWPEDIVRKYAAMLSDDGSVIVSVPNVGLWSVRLSLLLGRFEYGDTGVMDRTHLRFFTRASAKRLLKNAGLTPVRVTYNPGLVRPLVPMVKRAMKSTDSGALMRSRSYRIYEKTVYPLERVAARLWPGMLAFQMIIEARRKR